MQRNAGAAAPLTGWRLVECLGIVGAAAILAVGACVAGESAGGLAWR